MGQACSKMSCTELCCSEVVTDIGQEWIKENGTLYGNDQLPDKVQKGFEWGIQIVSSFHIFIGVGIIIFGVYTYNLREDIRRGGSKLVQDAFIHQLSLVPIYLLVVGSIVTAMSIIGLAGVLRSHIPLMITYLCFLFTYSIAQLICAILALTMRSRIEDNLYKYFSNDAIVNYREDIDLQNLMDYFQLNYGCCGGSDELGYLDWTKNLYFRCVTNNPSIERCSVPWSCCKNATDPTTNEPQNVYCGFNAQRKLPEAAGKYIYTGGCISAVLNYLSGYSGAIVAAICSLIIVPIILEILLVLLIRDVMEELQAYRNWEQAMKSDNREVRERAERVGEAAVAEISVT